VSSAPFFIVGSGRSGSTLLRVIMASHSRLSIPPETWYLLRLPDTLSFDRPLTPEETHQVIRIMTNHYRWPDMKLDAQEFRRKVLERHNPFLRDVVEIVYRAHLERDRKVRWGDKTPGYIEIVPRLAKLFPGARFIHFIRDGRDVAKSFQDKGWYGRWLHANAREWIEAMDFSERWARSDVSNQILDVHYEDLVLDTEKTVRRICNFLGEEFEPQMLLWQKKADQLVPAREAHIHEKLKQMPDAANVHRWKREMSAREIFVAEAFMGDQLRARGYELHFRSALYMPAFGLTRWYCRHVLPIVTLPVRAMRSLRGRLSNQPALVSQSGSRDEL
jgi:hypothetical protein